MAACSMQDCDYASSVLDDNNTLSREQQQQQQQQQQQVQTYRRYNKEEAEFKFKPRIKDNNRTVTRKKRTRKKEDTKRRSGGDTLDKQFLPSTNKTLSDRVIHPDRDNPQITKKQWPQDDHLDYENQKQIIEFGNDCCNCYHQHHRSDDSNDSNELNESNEFKKSKETNESIPDTTRYHQVSNQSDDCPFEVNDDESSSDLPMYPSSSTSSSSFSPSPLSSVDNNLSSQLQRSHSKKQQQLNFDDRSGGGQHQMNETFTKVRKNERASPRATFKSVNNGGGAINNLLAIKQQQQSSSKKTLRRRAAAAAADVSSSSTATPMQLNLSDRHLLLRNQTTQNKTINSTTTPTTTTTATSTDSSSSSTVPMVKPNSHLNHNHYHYNRYHHQHHQQQQQQQQKSNDGGQIVDSTGAGGYLVSDDTTASDTSLSTLSLTTADNQQQRVGVNYKQNKQQQHFNDDDVVEQQHDNIQHLFIDTGKYKHSPFGLRHHLSLPGAPTSPMLGPSTLHLSSQQQLTASASANRHHHKYRHHFLTEDSHNTRSDRLEDNNEQQQQTHNRQHTHGKQHFPLHFPHNRQVGGQSGGGGGGQSACESSMHSSSGGYLMTPTPTTTTATTTTTTNKIHKNNNNSNSGSSAAGSADRKSQFQLMQLNQDHHPHMMTPQTPSVVLVKFCSIVYAMFLIILGCILHISELKKKTQNSVDHIYSSLVAIIGMLWLAFLHVDLQRYKRFATRFLLLDENNLLSDNISENNSSSNNSDRMSLNTEVIFKRSAQHHYQITSQPMATGGGGGGGQSPNYHNNNIGITTSKPTSMSTGSSTDGHQGAEFSSPPAYKFLRGKIGASFYLKCGMAAFCFGHVVHEGLHFGQQVYFIVTDNGRCQDIPALVAHLITPLYSFYQLFIMFKYSNLVINRYKGFAYFGLMHVIGTSIAFWFRTIIEEAFDDFITKMDYFKHQNPQNSMMNPYMISSRPADQSFYLQPQLNNATSDHNSFLPNHHSRSASSSTSNNDSLNDLQVSNQLNSNTRSANQSSHNHTHSMNHVTGGGRQPTFDQVGDDDNTNGGHHISDPLLLSSVTSSSTISSNSLRHRLYPTSIGSSSSSSLSPDSSAIYTSVPSSLPLYAGGGGGGGHRSPFEKSASNISQNIIALMSPHLSVIAPQLAATLPDSYACSQNSLLTSKSMNALPYLYPFTIEYNLLIAATFLELYFNVGKMSTHAYDNPYRREIIKQNYDDNGIGGSGNGHGFGIVGNGNVNNIREVEFEYKSNFVVSADCHAANRGLFCGFFTLLVTLVSIVIFFVSISKPDHGVELGIKINLIQETTLILLILVVATLGFIQTSRLNRNPCIRDQITTNDTLMLIPLPFFFTHSLLSVKAEYGTVTTPLRDVSMFKWIAIFINLISLVEVLIQTSFIIDGLRRCSQSKYLRFKKPGRELLTFCIILNLTLWIVSTFESKSVEQYHVEIEYYGPLSWMFVSHTTLPVMLFYRYHSSVCLAEIWGRAYKAAKPY